ncbi:MAG TPA: glycoside hydrolase family 3 C-terminal domain-containing protein [Puia sp.]|jgi:beta-glucosidase|nr:glycoside hydrolase family 3 C-terminal domain-containing protein [Puia sp.]
MKLSLCTIIAPLILSGIFHSCQNNPNPTGKLTTPNDTPYLNPTLPVDQRVTDLVSRMTLDEKIGQMMNAAPAIPRLHIAAYNWWNESLHGVARAGLATVYPQAIGLAAAWDEDLHFRMATAISDEARAKYNDFIRQGKHDIYEGLTFFSPNINIFRDPRWGRGQETYGEDPYLTGRLAVQFIKGMQGDDPKYFKTIATVKHFAVHSGPESERHFFDARPDERDFRETYLPQFAMGVKEGKAFSVMCAYNRLYGQACCGSSRLLTTILRNEWGFQGYVVSDCGAIDDIYERHKVVSTADSAAVLAVRSGCDLECLNTYAHLKEAVAKKMITEQDIDLAVRRLFTARIRLGMFDPADSIKYNNIPYSVVDSKEHRQLALESARKSIVLLKNTQNALPLKKDLGTIAVIGPNADDSALLLGNYNGAPSYTITPLAGIRAKLGTNTRVLYAKGCELVAGMPHSVSAARMKDSALRIARQSDAIILCMGLSPRLEGEELKLDIPGFKGGDRTTLDLPKEQEDLIHAIAATGKPIVLVLLNGSAVAINWEDRHLPAIVEAWYPGQAGGTAIADVLFGDYNPAGRLPVTFYTSVKDLPDFGDYAMAGRTYRYFGRPVLYPFGYGLSYTTFHYDSLRIEKAVGPGDSLFLSVQVTNTGHVEGDEVAQVYISALDAKVPVPIRSLRGFQRIRLRPGQTMTLHFPIAPDAFTVIDDKMNRVPLYGKYSITAGGLQPFNPIPPRSRYDNTIHFYSYPSTSDIQAIVATIPNKAS